jgi:hypothetical protein
MLRAKANNGQFDCRATAPMLQNTRKIGPNRGLGRPKHTGWLQRQVLRCFYATDGPVRGSDLAVWCWPRLSAATPPGHLPDAPDDAAHLPRPTKTGCGPVMSNALRTVLLRPQVIATR